MANRKGPNFKDVEIEYFCNGMEGIRKLAADNDLSRGVLQNAANSLEGRGQDVADLNALITELHGAVGTGKGRTPPSVGQTRNYKAQQVKDGGVFGRIPLETLGLAKSEICNTAFCEDDEGPYLIVRPGAYSATDAPAEVEPEVPEAVEVDLGDEEF